MEQLIDFETVIKTQYFIDKLPFRRIRFSKISFNFERDRLEKLNFKLCDIITISRSLPVHL